MNIGEMLERISNDLYPSALHRVVGNKTLTARYSIPMFVAPKMDEVIEPQASRVERDAEKAFESTTFAEYLQMTLERVSVRRAERIRMSEGAIDVVNGENFRWK
jgi:isopenicillin N synthase-like dioxygenase